MKISPFVKTIALAGLVSVGSTAVYAQQHSTAQTQPQKVSALSQGNASIGDIAILNSQSKCIKHHGLSHRTKHGIEVLFHKKLHCPRA